MKTKTLRYIAVGAALAGGGCCWWLMAMQADGVRGAVKVPAGPLLEQQHQAANKTKEVVQWPEYGSPAFKKMAQERTEKWLNARGRDATGLIAIWDLTGDEALLKEAAEKYPGDVRVCMAMICRMQGKPREAWRWVETLQQVEPKNPAGYHLEAWVMSAEKNRLGALAALREAASCAGARNNHAVERATAVREAALAAGMSPILASRVALGAPFDRMLDCRLGGSVNRVILDEVAKLKKAGDEARLMEITGLGLTLAESMKRGTVTGERFASELEVQLLAELPVDTEIGAGGRGAGSLKEALEEQQLYVMQANRHGADVVERMRTGTEEWVVTYADCFLSHGELTAMQSMLELPEPEHEKQEE